MSDKPDDKKPMPKINVPTSSGLPPEKKPEPLKISVPTSSGLPPEKKPEPLKISVPTSSGLPPEKPAARPALKINIPTSSGLPPARPPTAAPSIPAPAATPEALEALKQRIPSLQSRLNGVRDKALLTWVKDNLEDVDAKLNELGVILVEVRAKGYAFGLDLEEKVQALRAQWPGVLTNAQKSIDQFAPNLLQTLQQAEGQFNHLSQNRGNFAVAYGAAEVLDTTLQNLEAAANAAERAIQATYDSTRNNIQQLRARLNGIQAMQRLFAEATFKLLAGEAAIAAVEAKWDKENTDQDPRGVLYLTDQRLLFEQKEDVATKKFLFVATEKQRVHQLLLQAPVARVRRVLASKKGLLGNEDHLDFDFEPGEVAVSKAHFHINGQDCNLWATHVNRAKAREFDQERVAPVDQAMLDKIANAPTQCPQCGSPFTQTILRGQTEIVCEACGSIQRL